VPLVKLLIASIISWLIVTIIHIVAFQWDGIDFTYHELPSLVPLIGLTSLFIACYMLIFGSVSLLLMRRFKLLSRVHYIAAGVICSIPMIFSGEIEWQIASMVSGLTSCLIMSSTVNNQVVT
jgi:hypothetical protein